MIFKSSLTAFFIGIATSTFSATIMIPIDQPTIQAGINVAINGDTVLVTDGVYTGDGNRDIDFGGKAISVMSVNGPEFTIIDCQGTSEENHIGFIFVNGETPLSVLEGFTIKNAWHTYGGGAIKCVGTSPTIQFCLMIDNVAYAGGAIACLNSSSPLLENCTFVRNTAVGDDGAVIYGGAPIVSKCIMTANMGTSVIAFSSPEISCTNIFGHTWGNWTDSIAYLADINGNLDTNALFCNPIDNDFHLSSLSPCAPDNNSCYELIGAFTVGCIAQHQTLFVSDDGTGDYPTIQAAINVAEPGDTVVLGDGTFSGNGNRDLIPRGKSLVFNSVNGLEYTLIDLEGSEFSQHRFITLNAGEFVEISGISFRNGVAPYDTIAQSNAGGLANCNGPVILRLKDCSVENCNATIGGGIACSNGARIYIDNCKFAMNVAEYGGGVYSNNGCELEVRNSEFSSNSASVNAPAIYSLQEGHLLIDSSEFTWNSCQGNGGGITSASNSHLFVYNSKFDRNYSGTTNDVALGAFNGGSCEISNSTFTNNNGNAIGVKQVNARITSVTTAGNLKSGIILSNVDTLQCIIDQCISAYDKNRSGIVTNAWDQVTCTNIYDHIHKWPGDSTDYDYGGTNIALQPLFCDWLSGDVSLTKDSPCLPQNNDCGVLIGAKGVGCQHHDGGITVNESGTGDAPNIQAAIDMAVHGDTILLEPGTYTGEGNYGISTKGKKIVLKSIEGPENTIIDLQGRAGQDRRGFEIYHQEDSTTEIIGITVKNGYHYNGAGFFVNYYSHPLFRNMRFFNNYAENAGGGGLTQYSAAIFDSCVFENNTALFASGLEIFTSLTAVTNSRFTNNLQATYNDGSTLEVDGLSTASIQNCVFDHNRRRVVVLDNRSMLQAEGCSFISNGTADTAAYAVFQVKGLSLAIVSNSLFVDNHTFFGAFRCDAAYVDISCTNQFENRNEEGSIIDWRTCSSEYKDTLGNFSADPLFCDIETSDYHLRPQSPCLPENNSCQVLIGALDAGCVPTSVENQDYEDDLENLPHEFQLAQNYPNPFNPSTTIHFELPKKSHVRVTVFNILGQTVRKLTDKEYGAGYYDTFWDGTDNHGQRVSSGIYFYRIEADEFIRTKKMVLLK